MWSILIGIVLVAIVHVVALTVVFTWAEGWDSACHVLYREQWGEWPSGVSIRMIERGYYVDPGYACEYWVDGEWLTLRKDLPGAWNTVMRITVAAVVAVGAGVVGYNRKLS